MRIGELKKALSDCTYLDTDEVMIQDSNGFIYDVDFAYPELIDDVVTSSIVLVTGQLQGGGYEDTGID